MTGRRGFLKSLAGVAAGGVLSGRVAPGVARLGPLNMPLAGLANTQRMTATQAAALMGKEAEVLGELSALARAYGSQAAAQVALLAPKFASAMAKRLRREWKDLDDQDGVKRNPNGRWGVFSWCSFCEKYDFSERVVDVMQGRICFDCAEELGIEVKRVGDYPFLSAVLPGLDFIV